MLNLKTNLPMGEKVRVRFFWLTIAMMALVVGAALFTIVTSFGRPKVATPAAPELRIAPAEVELCTGEAQQFAATSTDVEWTASGGTVSDSGLYVAGDIAGDYTVSVLPAGSGQGVQAVVHVVSCAPTPTPAPSPTPEPTVTATPEPPPPVPEDARGDVATYDTGVAVDSPPGGGDIRRASVRPDLALDLESTAGAPDELAGWVNEGEILLWIELWDPIPDPPTAYTEWLAALDLDGDPQTGRPAGSARINPDLGDEAALGVSFDPSSREYAPYLLIWDAAAEAWAAGPDIVRYTISASRTLVGLALPRDVLAETVEGVARTSIVPGMARGRMAVLGYVGEQAVIDFYPDRPQ